MFICVFCLIRKKEEKIWHYFQSVFEGIKVYQINMIEIKLRINLINIASIV